MCKSALAEELTSWNRHFPDARQLRRSFSTDWIVRAAVLMSTGTPFSRWTSKFTTVPAWPAGSPWTLARTYVPGPESGTLCLATVAPVCFWRCGPDMGVGCRDSALAVGGVEAGIAEGAGTPTGTPKRASSTRTPVAARAPIPTNPSIRTPVTTTAARPGDRECGVDCEPRRSPSADARRGNEPYDRVPARSPRGEWLTRTNTRRKRGPLPRNGRRAGPERGSSAPAGIAHPHRRVDSARHLDAGRADRTVAGRHLVPCQQGRGRLHGRGGDLPEGTDHRREGDLLRGPARIDPRSDGYPLRRCHGRAAGGRGIGPGGDRPAHLSGLRLRRRGWPEDSADPGPASRRSARPVQLFRFCAQHPLGS